MHVPQMLMGVPLPLHLNPDGAPTIISALDRKTLGCLGEHSLDC